MTREEAINQIILEKDYIEDIPGSDNTVKALNIAIETLKQSERKKAKWFMRYSRPSMSFHPDNTFDSFEFVCPSCESVFDKATNYCPNCGADMQGEE